MFIPCKPIGAKGGGAQTLADQLNLSQPGGEVYAHHITTGTPEFSDLPTALLKPGRCFAISKTYLGIISKKHEPTLS